MSYTTNQRLGSQGLYLNFEKWDSVVAFLVALDTWTGNSYTGFTEMPHYNHQTGKLEKSMNNYFWRGCEEKGILIYYEAWTITL